MKKQIYFTVLAAVALITLSCCSKKAEPVKNEAPKSEVKAEAPAVVSEGWLDCTSLKSIYVDSGIFEHIGFAVPAYNLAKQNIMDGIKYHVSSITLENETKPDTFMRNFANGITIDDMEIFTSSKGVSIRVPIQERIHFITLDNAMKNCKENGIMMRGHVLVWHSQTPRAFFCEEFNPGKPFVSIEEMDARQEWYIKSVLEHVTAWEKANNDGKHIIYAWDVVNEALSDNATADNYLRDASSSAWYAIYQSEDYIVNAFRYANKYAPKDLLLAYNDYNEFQGEKHNGYLKIIDSILDAKDDKTLPARIDIAGMQSHNQTAWPSISEYETCIKNFIAKGLDIQVTELDITGSWKGGNNFEKANPEAQKKTYYDYFKLYQKYRKTDSTNGISGITFWGITDEVSWRGAAAPLLFKGFKTKPAYYGVIEAAK